MKWGLSIGVNQSENLRPLKRDRNMLRRLKDLVWKPEVHDPWHPGEITLAQWIGFGPVVEVFRPFCRSRRLVRNLTTLYHTSNIVGGAGTSLPDPVQVWSSVRCSRDGGLGRRLDSGKKDCKQKYRHHLDRDVIQTRTARSQQFKSRSLIIVV
jgi:hypothetical protein